MSDGQSKVIVNQVYLSCRSRRVLPTILVARLAKPQRAAPRARLRPGGTRAAVATLERKREAAPARASVPARAETEQIADAASYFRACGVLSTLLFARGRCGRGDVEGIAAARDLHIRRRHRGAGCGR